MYFLVSIDKPETNMPLQRLQNKDIHIDAYQSGTTKGSCRLCATNDVCNCLGHHSVPLDVLHYFIHNSSRTVHLFSH